MAKVCERCGQWMEDGSVAYEVRIQVCADFDGVLVPPESGISTEAELRRLTDRLVEEDPAELLRSVYHSEQHLLCPGCRDRYLANPLNIPLREGGWW
jgi:hypothetical protein